MKLGDLQRNWDRLGASDPLWAIMSHGDKRDGAWNVDEFFATGKALIDETLSWVEASGVDLADRQDTAALDFGCGAGRLTQALAGRFDHVTGLDIAPSMIELADDLNRHGAACRYVLNGRADLSVFDNESFDFICSYIVLQHMEPRYALRYLAEFLRVLRPGGVLVFQLPSEPVATWKGRLRRLLARPRIQPLLNLYRRLFHRRAGAMEMYSVPRQRIEALLTSAEHADVAVLDVVPCSSAGPTWVSYRYMVQKATAESPQVIAPAETPVHSTSPAL